MAKCVSKGKTFQGRNTYEREERSRERESGFEG